MLIAILGDTHLGVRNDLNLFHDHFDTFYDQFVAHLKHNNISDVFQLGDLFDRRKYINFNTLSRSKTYLFDRLREAGIRMHVLIGNHDIFFKDTLTVNSPSLVLQEYINDGTIVLYDTPTSVAIYDTTIDIIPWICKDNEDDALEFIIKSKSDICMGHFELVGFPMYRGVDAHGGMATDIFEKYELVLSGHYHTKSQKGNITYVGTPYEMTWQDYNDPKGFHTFDTETRQLTFIPKTNPIFVRIDYDDTKEMLDLDFTSLKNKYVKVVVTNKTDLYKFDQFINTIYNSGCYDVKVVEDLSEFQEGDIDEEIDLEDTLDVLSSFIDSIDTDANKDEIKRFMKTLYIEALHVGE